MNDQEAEIEQDTDWQELLDLATSKARYAMKSAQLRGYGVEDIVGQMIVKYIEISRTEPVPNPRALMRKLAFNFVMNARRDDKGLSRNNLYKFGWRYSRWP